MYSVACGGEQRAFKQKKHKYIACNRPNCIDNTYMKAYNLENIRKGDKAMQSAAKAAEYSHQFRA